MSLIFCSDLFVIACTQNTLNLCADWGCTKHEVYVVWNSAAPNGKFFDLAMVLWAWRWSRFYSPLLFVRSNHQRRREVQSLWMLQIWISEFKTNFQFFFENYVVVCIAKNFFGHVVATRRIFYAQMNQETKGFNAETNTQTHSSQWFIVYILEGHSRTLFCVPNHAMTWEVFHFNM